MPENIGIKAIATALGVDGEEFISSLKDENGEFLPDAQQRAQEALTNRIKLLRDDDKKKAEEKLQNLTNKAVKETAGSWESKLKKFLPEDSELTGPEAYAEALQSVLESKGKSKPENYNFKADPEFIKYENELKAQFQKQADEKIGEANQKLEEIQNAMRMKEVNDSLEQQIRLFWATRKPAFEDKTVIENQINMHKQRVLQQYRVAVIDGKPTLLNGEGEQLKDEMGNTIGINQAFVQTFEGFVPELVQNGRSSSGLQREGMDYKGAMPKNWEEAERMVNDNSISPADRLKIVEYAEKTFENK